MDLTRRIASFFMIKRKPKLVVTHTNFGRFRSAKIDGKPISKEHLYSIINVEDLKGFRIEYYLHNFSKNSNQYEVEIWESNVE